MRKAARSLRKNACPTAILIDELDTGGFNSSVFPWLELDDQSVAVMQAHHGSTPEFSDLGNRSPAAPIFSLNWMPEDSSPLRPWAWSSREIGFVSQKSRGRLSALRLCRLPKAHTWSTTVLVEEHDPSGSQATFVFGSI
jgi:hypothetical protein